MPDRIFHSEKVKVYNTYIMPKAHWDIISTEKGLPQNTLSCSYIAAWRQKTLTKSLKVDPVHWKTKSKKGTSSLWDLEICKNNQIDMLLHLMCTKANYRNKEKKRAFCTIQGLHQKNKINEKMRWKKMTEWGEKESEKNRYCVPKIYCWLYWFIWTLGKLS